MQLARPARLYIVGICCLSLALVLRVLGSYPVQGSAGFWLLVLAMTALATVGDRYPVLVAPGMYLQVSTIPLFASLLIFNPAVTIIIAGASSLASQLWRRSPRVELVFNLAQTLVYV